MEPGAERVADPERPRLADQDQEGGLEGVLGVVRVAEDAPADAQDHRPVPLDQGREGQLGRLAAPGREPLEELAVGQSRRRSGRQQRAELPREPAGPFHTRQILP